MQESFAAGPGAPGIEPAHAAVTIGALARATGVNLETIRYYERIGLMPLPGRSESGYRLYGEAAARRLAFIRRGRELGFGIDEIRGLLALAAHPEQPCGEADVLVRAHIAEVDARIRDLQALRDELAGLAGCASTEAAHCRLLEALDNRRCCG